MNRREFLKTLGGAGIAIPGLLAGSACGPVVVQSDLGSGLSLGYISGDVTANSALIWLRAEPSSQISLHYSKDRSFAEYGSVGAFTPDSSADHTAIVAIEGLDPASRYYYRAAVRGKTVGPAASFLTAPRPDDAAKVAFCFSGDTRESYQPFTVMRAVEAHRPDFFLHLGDTIYADRGGTARSLEEFWQKYRANRNDPFHQSCFASTSVYAVWDDHEVADNYLPGHPLAPIGRKAFLDYWPIRRSVAEPERIYRSVRWGSAVELFLLDTRQYRDPKRATMLGKAQCEWLFDGLARSAAAFKFIATTVPMAGGGSDRWDGYPKERAQILRFINDKKLPGVAFLSADLHCAAVTKIPQSGGLLDITAGPLASPLNRVTDGTNRRYEFFRAENFNFAKITVDPKVNANEALLEFIDQDNQVFHTRKIRA